MPATQGAEHCSAERSAGLCARGFDASGASRHVPPQRGSVRPAREWHDAPARGHAELWRRQATEPQVGARPLAQLQSISSLPGLQLLHDQAVCGLSDRLSTGLARHRRRRREVVVRLQRDSADRGRARGPGTERAQASDDQLWPRHRRRRPREKPRARAGECVVSRQRVPRPSHTAPATGSSTPIHTHPHPSTPIHPTTIITSTTTCGASSPRAGTGRSLCAATTCASAAAT